jgi:hypothetical protein
MSSRPDTFTFEDLQESIGAQFHELLSEIVGVGSETDPITPDRLYRAAQAAADRIFELSVLQYPGKWIPAVTVTPWENGQLLVSVVTIPRVSIPPTLN